MPTPSGMARKGDVVANAVGRWRVIERCGNDEIYAVKLVPLDGQGLPPRFQSRSYMLVTEFPYWLKHGWKFVAVPLHQKPKPFKPLPDTADDDDIFMKGRRIAGSAYSKRG